MKAFVEHMRNNNGNVVKNQFINHLNNKKVFQSYDTIIATVDDDGTVTLDSKSWNYSRTTNITTIQKPITKEKLYESPYLYTR